MDFTEEKDPWTGCCECCANTFDFDTKAAQNSLKKQAQKFRSPSAFKNRMRNEFVLNRKALGMFLRENPPMTIIEKSKQDGQKRITKISSEIAVWDLARNLKLPKKLQNLSMSVKTHQKKAPIDEEPDRIKDFPLTQESLKKHIEKETAQKKAEKLDTVQLLKKKQKELRRLKDELIKQAKKQFCHHVDKKEEYEKKKWEYLEKMAKEHNLSLEVLTRNGDIIYKKHRLDLKRLHAEKIKNLEERVDVISRMIDEEKAKKRMKGVSHSMQTVLQSYEKKPIISTESEVDILPIKSLLPKYDESTGQKHQISLKLDVKPRIMPKKGLLRRSQQSAKPRKNSRNTKRNSPLNPLRPETRESIQSKTAWIKSTKLKSEIDPLIIQLIKKFEYTWKLIDLSWCPEKKEPKLPDNTSLVIRPSSILINGFLPTKVYRKTVNVYNPTNKIIDCIYYKIVAEPELPNEEMFKIWPDLVIRIRPGGNQDFSIYFTTNSWSELKNGVRAVIWFWFKVIKTSELFRSVVNVQCNRFISNIKVLTNTIEFSGVTWWSKNIFKKYLEICNYSSLDYIVYIHREILPQEEEIYIVKEHMVPAFKKMMYSLNEKHKDLSSVVSTKQKRDYNLPVMEQEKSLASLMTINLEKEGEVRPSMECLVIVNSMLVALIEEVYRPFRIQLTRGSILPKQTKISIPIQFEPKLVRVSDRIEDKLIVKYEGNFLTHEKEIVKLSASFAEMPITVSTGMVDLQVTMVGVGVWQTLFEVINTSGKFCTARVKFPAEVRKHFSAIPNVFIIRPYKKEQVLLRAKIGWNIYEESYHLLKKNLSLLEFQFYIQPNGFPEISVGALAVICHPLALTIEPNIINLGFVSTAETVVEEFWLKNHSVVALHFAFINLPKWCMVMPSYGISTIGPAQKIKLQLLYSPTSREAGKPGGQAVHTFSISCTTLERLSADPSTKIPHQEEKVLQNSKNILRKTYEEQLSTLNQFLGIPVDQYLSEESKSTKSNEESVFESLSFLNENLLEISFEENKESISHMKHHADLSYKSCKSVMPLCVSTSEHSINDDVAYEESMIGIEPEPNDATPEKNLKPYITLKCKAVVFDPICELSAQKIIIPDTPYGSFNINSIYIRCPNQTGGSNCHCGRFVGLLDNSKADFEAHFQFFNYEKGLEIQPVSGKLSFGELSLDSDELPESTNKGVGWSGIPYKLTSPKKSASSNKLPHTDLSSKSRHSKKHSKPMSAHHQNRKARLAAFRNKEPVPFYAKVKCLVETKLKSAASESRFEVLRCEVISRFIRPDIVVITPRKSEIIFSKTAIGTKNCESIEVHNTSEELLYVTRSFLGHRDIFSCSLLPPSPSSYIKYKGVPIEPEEYLKLEITFNPLNEELVEEYFELRANKTVISLKVTGQGVIPRYLFSSNFSLCKMETHLGGKVVDSITIMNECDAELKFEVINCFQMETYNPEVFSTCFSEANIKVSGGRRTSNKHIYKELVSPVIYEELHNYFNDSYKPSAIEVEPSLLSIPPHKKGLIKISFRPKNINSIDNQVNISEPSRKNKDENFAKEIGMRHHKMQESKPKSLPTSRDISSSKTLPRSLSSCRISINHLEGRTSEYPTAHAVKVKIMLGRMIMAAEWLIIGKVIKSVNKKNTQI